ncbi:hypothetical protein FKM82_021482 [Ascaphus truei]|uniref:bcl-2-like protein 1 n=1 Tax=Ascaphus truei TaxID=8439 RepID=UPI003F59DCB6
MLEGNIVLVQDFVSHKLTQKGFGHSSDLQFEAMSNGTSSRELPGAHGGACRESAVRQKVLTTLQETSDEFELRYQRAFSDLTAQLHITPDSAYESFAQVVGELFRDGTNWGRIVAFFSFGGALCVESADKEMKGLLPRIVQWMATYLDTQLGPWIEENGGWEAFVSTYGNNAATESRKSQERFGRWLLTGVTLAGVVLLASYVTRR